MKFSAQQHIAGTDPSVREDPDGRAGWTTAGCITGARCAGTQQDSWCDPGGCCILQCSAGMLLAIKIRRGALGRCRSQAEHLCLCPGYVTAALALPWLSCAGPRAAPGQSAPWVSSHPKKLWEKVSRMSLGCSFCFAKELAWKAHGKTPPEVEVAPAL